MEKNTLIVVQEAALQNKSTANGAPLVSYAVVVNEHLKRHFSPSVFSKNQPIDLDLDRLGRAGWTEWAEWSEWA